LDKLNDIRYDGVPHDKMYGYDAIGNNLLNYSIAMRQDADRIEYVLETIRRIIKIDNNFADDPMDIFYDQEADVVRINLAWNLRKVPKGKYAVLHEWIAGKVYDICSP